MAFKRFRDLLLTTGTLLLLVVTTSAADPMRIVGFGDSLMAGYQLEAGQSFPEKLEAALKGNGHDVVIANAGVSGDTTMICVSGPAACRNAQVPRPLYAPDSIM